MALAPSPQGRGSKGKGSSGEQNRLSPSGGKAHRGLGLQECWALPSTGRTQAELGQCWHWRYLTVPASSTYSPAQGQNTRGPGQPPKAGTV